MYKEKICTTIGAIGSFIAYILGGGRQGCKH